MIVTTFQEFQETITPYREALRGTGARKQATYEATRKLMHQLPLPEFMNPGPFNPDYTIDIRATDQGYEAVILNENQELVKTFPTASEAYHFTNDVPANITFTGEITLLNPHNKDAEDIYENDEWLITMSDKEVFELKAMKYAHFLLLTEDYYNNPEDFFLSYRWVTNHPMFWSRHTAESTEWKTNYDEYWLEINRNSSQELVYMLEAGPAYGTARVEHSHDLRLDVYAPSFEEAFIKLAALVDKFYDLEGNHKPNVHYIPSELETLLTERLKSWDEENGKGKKPGSETK